MASARVAHPGTAADTEAAAIIRALLRARGAGKSICPSEVARAMVGGDRSEAWRSRMDEVREAAAQLTERGEVEVTRRGVLVDPRAARGPIRIALPRPRP